MNEVQFINFFMNFALSVYLNADLKLQLHKCLPAFSPKYGIAGLKLDISVRRNMMMVWKFCDTKKERSGHI